MIGDEQDRISAISGIVWALALIKECDLVVAKNLGDERARSEALQTAAWSQEKSNLHEHSLAVLREAFMTSRLVGREEVFAVLADGAATLAKQDSGDTLWQIYQAIQEIDGW